MLLLLLVFAAAPADSSPCPPERQVNVSPERWKAELQRAAPGELDRGMERMHLPAVTSPEREAPKLERVDLFEANLSGSAAPDRVVQARFSTRFSKAYLADHATGLSPEVRLYRIQVLRKVAGGWCAAGSDLSLDEPVEEPNAGPADGMKDTHLPMTFGFVHFSHGDRQTLEVRRPFDNLSRASSTGVLHQWWDVADGRLLKVLELSESDATCRPCDLPYQRTTLEQQGPPPVTVVQRLRSCSQPDGGGECTLERGVYAPGYVPVP